MITTSEIKISVLVDREHAVEALRTVHAVFELHLEPRLAGAGRSGAVAPSGPNDTADVVARMQGMEDLLIEDIVLDQSQARVTISGVPDRPGMAAQIFEEIASAGIIVDMIVQSVGREGTASVSFTVPHKDIQKSLALTGSLAQRLGCPPPTGSPQVAKLSVFGVGMRSQTGVAARLFQSLAAAGINVDMISTSEVRLNVVVEGLHGAKALEVLRKEFADVII